MRFGPQGSGLARHLAEAREPVAPEGLVQVDLARLRQADVAQRHVGARAVVDGIERDHGRGPSGASG